MLPLPPRSGSRCRNGLQRRLQQLALGWRPALSQKSPEHMRSVRTKRCRKQKSCNISAPPRRAQRALCSQQCSPRSGSALCAQPGPHKGLFPSKRGRRSRSWLWGFGSSQGAAVRLLPSLVGETEQLRVRLRPLCESADCKLLAIFIIFFFPPPPNFIEI